VNLNNNLNSKPVF